ncbi:MAG: hypothetical protein NWE79_05355 [Candidatus Bathyarchaeota archaeon]|nr:hypothetical protein [Candidatus Bathyarchaeota archaeon]MCW3992114.1 hypothetical protein [Candidatus Bathyarchaeota archaeon]
MRPLQSVEHGHKYDEPQERTMGERSLHAATKSWYARPGDQTEVRVDDYVVDIVRGDLLIEIQTRNFPALRAKLRRLIRDNEVRLVHPIPQRKWIVRMDSDGETVLSRRRSPKRGRVEDVFSELIYMPRLVKDPNLSLEVLLVHSEDVWIDDGMGSWRRRHWSIHDRRLLDVVERVLFETPEDFIGLLPPTLPEEFTAKDLSQALMLRPNVAQRMAYCLRHMGSIEAVGKRGRALLYRIPPLYQRARHG